MIEKNIAEKKFETGERIGLEYLIENTTELKEAVEIQYLIDIYDVSGASSLYKRKKEELLQKMNLN